MKITVLDRKSMGLDLDFSILSKIGDDINIEIFDETKPDDVMDRIQKTDVVILNKVKLNESLLRSTKRLKLICVFATGFDNIDVKAARNNAIAVCNVPAYSTESVLLLTVSTALSLAAKLPEFHAYVQDGRYSVSGVPNYLTPIFHECKGMTWGIVGCGNIGSRVAEVAKALGMRVIVYQRHPSAYENVDLDTLCRQSDILSLHCPLTAQTRGLIGEAELSKMKKNCILVNEARGAVVDEGAVAEAVEKHVIGGYGSDVFSVEPLPAEHPLFAVKDMDNVMLTPHIAWAAYESRVRCLNIIYQNILDWQNKKSTNRVDI